MRKKAWVLGNRTGLGILGVVLVFGMTATGCPMGNDDPPATATTYTVTFDTGEGSSSVPNQTVEEGKTVTKPTAPTKADHTFINWYRNEAKTLPWNFNTDVVVTNTTLYARWGAGTLPSYKVTFDPDGGSPAPEPQSVLRGEPILEPLPEPSKPRHIFVGWYNGKTVWDFDTNTVTADITLKAEWVQAVTVLFTSGGKEINSVMVASGGPVDLYSYQPSKDGNVFEGWYMNVELTKSAGSYLPKVTEDTILYAKWTPTSELAPYAGVWRQDGGGNNESYWLQADGTAWSFSAFSDSFRLDKTEWSTSQIDGQEGRFNTEKTQFTLSADNGSVHYRKTNETKPPTPATAASNLLGTWVNGSGSSIELKNDGEAVLKDYYGNSITLKYCAEPNAVRLLKPDDNLVIASITVSGGKLAGLSKPANDNALAGIWKLAKDGQDFYWNLKADGSGTFHTLGASVPFSFTVTNDKKIDGMDYTVSGNTLTLPYMGDWDPDTQSIDLVLSKVDSVPSGSGADGIPYLRGTWRAMEGNETITFNSNGTFVQSGGGENEPIIWKADGNTLYFYSPEFGYLERNVPYSVSVSTITLYGMKWTR